MTDTALERTFVFDARGIAKRFRHSSIFAALESLDHGETMRFVNDHDPVPLLHQIHQRYGDQIRIRYVERNPERIVIDFAVWLTDTANDAPAEPAVASCGGGTGGCGCSG